MSGLFDIEKKDELFEKVFKEHIKVETYSKSIESLTSIRNLPKINYKPYYQRNYVWDKNKATYFIESILIGTDIPPLVFFENKKNTEVLDGRQRFETILRFMKNDFNLTAKGLDKISSLKKKRWEDLQKEQYILNSFLDAKLRIIHFRLVNEPPLDRFLEDRIKKEIFSRYNSGITPLKKAEVENAIYNDDDLTNQFKSYFKKNTVIRNNFVSIFFPNKKNAPEKVSIDIMMSIIRRYIVFPRFPIIYYARGTGRTEVLEKMYEKYVDDNSGQELEVISEFLIKFQYLVKMRDYCEHKKIPYNRLSMECLFWGLGVLEMEEINFDHDSETLLERIASMIELAFADFAEQDSNFYQSINTRFQTMARIFSEIYNIELSLYLYTSIKKQQEIKNLKQSTEDYITLSDVDSLRIQKPQPYRNSIDDIDRMMKRKKFLVRPSYQRKEVINPQKASSIIESILLGIEIPPIFIYKREDGVNEVIDGQQRLLTILGFIGSEYLDENDKYVKSKNHNFKLRNLRILNELESKTFTELNENQRNKIFDFQLYLIEIDERQNPNFDQVDLFIRLNDKPYPIRENSFEMWNSWVDIDVINRIKNLKAKNFEWFYLRSFQGKNDRDRMENEELITSLIYLSYMTGKGTARKILDIYQKTDRINARITSTSNISTLLSNVNEETAVKDDFIESSKEFSSFIKKLKTVLLDRDKKKSELQKYLRSELDFILKAGKVSRYFRRTKQDFYLLWTLLSKINFEMVKFHRLDMKKEIQDIFLFAKNIPDKYIISNTGNEIFNNMIEKFQKKYEIDNRTLKLSEKQKIELITKQNGISPLSGAPVFLGDELEADHIHSIATGGDDSIENIQITHMDENRSKGV